MLFLLLVFIESPSEIAWREKANVTLRLFGWRLFTGPAREGSMSQVLYWVGLRLAFKILQRVPSGWSAVDWGELKQIPWQMPGSSSPSLGLTLELWRELLVDFRKWVSHPLNFRLVLGFPIWWMMYCIMWCIMLCIMYCRMYIVFWHVWCNISCVCMMSC
jgi:hypothetical protein